MLLFFGKFDDNNDIYLLFLKFIGLIFIVFVIFKYLDFFIILILKLFFLGNIVLNLLLVFV